MNRLTRDGRARILHLLCVEIAPSGDRLIALPTIYVARVALDTPLALWPTAAIELRQKGPVIVCNAQIS
jgi:hypothetical protein